MSYVRKCSYRTNIGFIIGCLDGGLVQSNHVPKSPSFGKLDSLPSGRKEKRNIIKIYIKTFYPSVKAEAKSNILFVSM